MLDQKENKTASLRVSVTEKEKEIISQAAENEGIKLSEFIRKAIKFYLNSKEVK